MLKSVLCQYSDGVVLRHEAFTNKELLKNCADVPCVQPKARGDDIQTSRPFMLVKDTKVSDLV